MVAFSLERDFAFMVSDVARMLRTLFDQEARKFGMTRAQWGVLFRLERSEGLKQGELADVLDELPADLESLAIVFLHSYANREHERLAADRHRESGR